MAFPKALPHGQLEEVFPNIFFVTGSVILGPVPMRFSRNMAVVRQEGSLVLINSLRLDESGLKALDALGKVEHVIRLAGVHGMDDPFYKDRYDAKIWVVKGQVYAKGFAATKTPVGQGYFKPDIEMDRNTELPISGASLLTIAGLAPEGLLRLEQEGGILVAGDALQNYGKTDEYFNWLGGFVMKRMGFIKPYNVGPAWLKQARPNLKEVRSILDLEFEHLFPVHGAKVIGGAKEKYRPAIERSTS